MDLKAPNRKIRVYIVAGYTQNKATWNGSISISEQLREEWNGSLESVSYLPWNSDWKAQAEYMWLIQDRREDTCPKDVPVNILCGYSYGGGYGAKKLMDHCLARGVRFEHVILCDPVSRNPLGWLGKWWVKIPKNVKNVWLLRQEVDYPRGCKVTVDPKYTSEAGIWMLGSGHTYCDDNPAYLEAINKAIVHSLMGTSNGIPTRPLD